MFYMKERNLPIPPYSGKQALLLLKFSRRSIVDPSDTTIKIVNKSDTTVSGKAIAAKLFLLKKNTYHTKLTAIKTATFSQ